MEFIVSNIVIMAQADKQPDFKLLARERRLWQADMFEGMPFQETKKILGFGKRKKYKAFQVLEHG